MLCVFFHQTKPAALRARNNLFHIIWVFCVSTRRGQCLTVMAFTSRIVESANLIGLLINYNCSARSIFTNSYIKPTFNLVKDFSVHIWYVSTDDVFRKRICWDDTFFIKSIQENFCIAFIYTKKLGVSMAFFF